MSIMHGVLIGLFKKRKQCWQPTRHMPELAISPNFVIKEQPPCYFVVLSVLSMEKQSCGRPFSWPLACSNEPWESKG